jgi:hypothetical protein
MTTEQFQAVLKAQPFRPFVIRTADGREYRVDHPELAWRTPSGRTIVISTGGDDIVILDPLLVTALELTTAKGH